MDTFSKALLSSESGRISEEYDWFAPLVGDWDCDYYDELNNQPDPGGSRGAGYIHFSLQKHQGSQPSAGWRIWNLPAYVQPGSALL